MQLKPEEISKVIRSQIKYYENAIQQVVTEKVLNSYKSYKMLKDGMDTCN